MTATCVTCRYYKPDDRAVVVGFGECRRSAPRPVQDTRNVFPLVTADCWCGQHDPRRVQP